VIGEEVGGYIDNKSWMCWMYCGKVNEVDVEVEVEEVELESEVDAEMSDVLFDFDEFGR
jgi:hypothetical protein